MKITTSGGAETTELGGAQDARYDTITPGRYFAAVTKISTSFYETKGQKYLKFTPIFRLLTEIGTVINKYDITVGAVNEKGQLFNPRDASKSPIFGQARFLMGALGFNSLEDFDTNLVAGQVIQIYVDNQRYEVAVRDENNNPTGEKEPKVKNVVGIIGDNGRPDGGIYKLDEDKHGQSIDRLELVLLENEKGRFWFRSDKEADEFEALLESEDTLQDNGFGDDEDDDVI